MSCTYEFGVISNELNVHWYLVKLDPELLKQSLHVSRLLIYVRVVLWENKNSELRLRELLPGHQDVGHEQGQASVVVKPVDVDKPFIRLVGSELNHGLDDVVIVDLSSVAVGQPRLGLLIFPNDSVQKWLLSSFGSGIGPFSYASRRRLRIRRRRWRRVLHLVHTAVDGSMRLRPTVDLRPNGKFGRPVVIGQIKATGNAQNSDGQVKFESRFDDFVIISCFTCRSSLPILLEPYQHHIRFHFPESAQLHRASSSDEEIWMSADRIECLDVIVLKPLDSVGLRGFDLLPVDRVLDDVDAFQQWEPFRDQVAKVHQTWTIGRWTAQYNNLKKKL